jgi:peptidyl-prolyl cis-trans isomerase B (cyclophilin B)
LFWVPCLGLVLNAVLSPLGASRAKTRGEPQARYWFPLVASAVMTLLVPLVLAGVGALAFLTSSAEEPTGGEPTVTAERPPLSTEPPAEAGAAPGQCRYVPSTGQAAGRDVELPAASAPLTGGTQTVTLDTTAGTVEVGLDVAGAPCATRSFVSLTAQQYFDGTSCHRLTTAGIYVLQCGDPTGTGTGGPGYTFATENLPAANGTAATTYPAGTVAMANAGPDTDGSQFFIVYRDTTLPPDYGILGHVTDGLDVIEEIAERGVRGGGSDGPPAAPVTLEQVTVK